MELNEMTYDKKMTKKYVTLICNELNLFDLPMFNQYIFSIKYNYLNNVIYL